MLVSTSELRASLEAALTRYGVPGASFAILSEESVVATAAGTANVRSGVAVTPDTVMHIGSIAKVFTATLIMQLVDEGRVDLDEKVLRYLPALKLRDTEALRQITVRMLLDHTSGIDGTMLPDCGHDEETIEKAVLRFASLGQIHRPGAEYSYCNAATVIAGLLVQRSTGTSWYQLIRERIFEPLRMRHAVTLPEEALLHRAAVGHYRDPHLNKPVTVSRALLPLSFAPGGTTLMMSASDLLRFAGAHIANGVGPNGVRILSELSARAMQQIVVDNQGKRYTYTDGIGIGWMVCNGGLLHHSGGGPGIASVLYVHPAKQFAAALLTNAEPSLSWKMITELIAPCLDARSIEAPIGLKGVPYPTAPFPISSPDQYVGVYENAVTRYRVSRDSGTLVVTAQTKWALYDYTSLEESQPLRLVPIDESTFIAAREQRRDRDRYDPFSTYTFRNTDQYGRRCFLGNFDQLYPRVA